MPGEKDLKTLLATLNPVLHEGEYVFCSVKKIEGIEPESILFYFREPEGVTLVLEKSRAEALQLEYTYLASWITLRVHSALEAVGLTAAFSRALTEAGISCNVVAAYYHDHLFVDRKDADEALAVLRRLSATHSHPPNPQPTNP
jgi:uncharacterized protein